VLCLAVAHSDHSLTVLSSGYSCSISLETYSSDSHETFTYPDVHSGFVSALATCPQFHSGIVKFISGGMDGIVKLSQWDLKSQAF
jgi:WD40 repeat protein